MAQHEFTERNLSEFCIAIDWEDCDDDLLSLPVTADWLRKNNLLMEVTEEDDEPSPRFPVGDKRIEIGVVWYSGVWQFVGQDELCETLTLLMGNLTRRDVFDLVNALNRVPGKIPNTDKVLEQRIGELERRLDQEQEKTNERNERAD